MILCGPRIRLLCSRQNGSFLPGEWEQMQLRARGLWALIFVHFLATPVAHAQQTAGTLAQGSITAPLKRVNVISGGSAADAIYGTFAPGDNRLFLVQKTGSIRY